MIKCESYCLVLTTVKILYEPWRCFIEKDRNKKTLKPLNLNEDDITKIIDSVDESTL